MICTHHISSSSMHIFLPSFLPSFLRSFVRSFIHLFTPPFFRVSRPFSWPLPVAVINRQISGSDQLTFARASASTSTGVKPTSLTATSAWGMVAGLLNVGKFDKSPDSVHPVIQCSFLNMLLAGDKEKKKFTQVFFPFGYHRRKTGECFLAKP